MQIKILTQHDLDALAEIAGLQNYRSVIALLVEYIEFHAHANGSDNVIITISKSLIPNTYGSNPSMMGLGLLNRLRPNFVDSSGTQDHLSGGENVTVKLLTERKPFNGRWTHAKPTAKQLIKSWLDLNLPIHAKLKIPIDGIASTYQIYPAQLAYQIHQETKQRIKFTRLTKSWLITRK